MINLVKSDESCCVSDGYKKANSEMVSEFAY